MSKSNRDKEWSRNTNILLIFMWLVVYLYVVVLLSVGWTLSHATSRANSLFNCCVSLTQSVPSNKKMMATFGKTSSRAWINDSGTSHSRRTPYPLTRCHTRPIHPATPTVDTSSHQALCHPCANTLNICPAYAHLLRKGEHGAILVRSTVGVGSKAVSLDVAILVHP